MYGESSRLIFLQASEIKNKWMYSFKLNQQYFTSELSTKVREQSNPERLLCFTVPVPTKQRVHGSYSITFIAHSIRLCLFEQYIYNLTDTKTLKEDREY